MNRYLESWTALIRLKDEGEVVVQTGLPADGGIEVLSGLKAGDVVRRGASQG